MIRRADIDAALLAYNPQRREARSSATRAAVLVPLIERPSGVSVLFIQRPLTMRNHGGQPAFPGGKVDPGDADTWAAALRESDEELGLPAAAITQAGRLDDLPTITGYHVTPWVGWIRAEAPLDPSPAEVDEVFTVPIADLLDPSRVRTMTGSWRPGPPRIHFYLTRPHVVWGATAAMVTSLLEVIRQR